MKISKLNQQRRWIKMRKDYKQQYGKGRLISLESDMGIHMALKGFMDMFPTYESQPRDCEEYPTMLISTVEDTTFFCLVGKDDE